MSFFGTDGVRGRVGGSVIHPEAMMKLGWSVGQMLHQLWGNRPSVLIGKDTRLSGYMIESALESGLSASGVDIKLLGPMPTPAVAYLTQTLRASLGLVISASHNPHHDNGIKFFTAFGEKLSDEHQLMIEQNMSKPMNVVSNDQLGKAYRISSAAERYIEKCKSYLPQHHSLNGLHVVLDCANGANYHIAKPVFHELGATVTALNDQPNGLNINDQCGATSPQFLQQKVLELGADMGFAFDGDGDRLVVVDDRGVIWDGDDVLSFMASFIPKGSGVVGTVMSNQGLAIDFQRKNIPFLRSSVGDRSVFQLLRKSGWKLGGEPSGHLLDLRYMVSGDALIAAVLLLGYLLDKNKPLHEWRLQERLPQVLRNARYTGTPDQVLARIDSLKKHWLRRLGDNGRILIRPSGTEPLIRVMVEGESQTMITEAVDEIYTKIQEAA